jgi:acetylornithine deacetylase/succinyl-diaminopimelate desuccinylase-like protein
MPVDRATLDAFLRAHQNTFVEELVELVRPPSISTQRHPGVRACAEALLGTMQRSGLEAELLATADQPIVFGQRLVDAQQPTVLIYGHYDVQPVDPLEAWQSPPFEPVVRHGRLYGRGSSDNKGQHLAQLLAVRALLELGGELPLNVKVILEGEEETADHTWPASSSSTATCCAPTWPTPRTGRCTTAAGRRSCSAYAAC